MTKEVENQVKLQPIYEIVRIKAERRKLPKKYLSENLTDYTVRSPEDFANIAMKFIGNEDREVFLVACEKRNPRSTPLPYRNVKFKPCDTARGVQNSVFTKCGKYHCCT